MSQMVCLLQPVPVSGVMGKEPKEQVCADGPHRLKQAAAEEVPASGSAVFSNVKTSRTALRS